MAADRERPLVWVTRAEPGAARTAARLRDLGYTPLAAPLIETRALAFAPPDDAAYDVLAFTSAAGVAAFAGACAGVGPSVPVFAVGAATAEAARAAGFTAVRSADGDGRALCALLLKQTPDRARVLHPAAARPAFDLTGALRQAGRAASSLPVYETRRIPAIPTAADLAIADGSLRAILIHSPAAARALAALAPVLGGREIALVALSTACARPVEGLGVPTLVAAAPNEADLLAALADLRLTTGPPPDRVTLASPAPPGKHPPSSRRPRAEPGPP